MALAYQDLFEDIGSFIKAINALRAQSLSAGTIETQLDNIKTVLASHNREDVLSGVQESYDGMKDAVVGWVAVNLAKIEERFLHKETILEELTAVGPAPTILTVLKELNRQMGVDTREVDANTVTVGAQSDDASNNGNCEIFGDKVLDGVSIPILNGTSCWEWKDVNSELSSDEDMIITCIADEDSDGLPEGEERFSIVGQPIPPGGVWGWKNEGSGTNIEVQTLNSHHIIANKDFESWSANVPASWDLDGGVAGTDILQETTAADVHRGDSALQFVGDGSTDPLKISQTLPAAILTPRKRYCLGCFVKGEAGIASGTLTIQFESPSGGYSAGASEKIELNAAALAAQTTYDEEKFWITAPDTIPDDLELVIKITGALTSAKNVRIDSLAFGPVEWANGVSFAILTGSSQTVKGDRYTVNVANDNVGVFQEFFRKQYRFQLRSTTGGTEDILDNWAT